MSANELINAVLALDSYNRGYLPGIDNNNVKKIGDYTVGIDSSVLGTIVVDGQIVRIDQNAGFYATTYQEGSQTIISIRGTDQLPASSNPLDWKADQLSDIINGWLVGAGETADSSSQMKLAIQFYQSVAGAGNWQTSNIALTGHSLGGGLSGEVAGLYGKSATVFDAMPFMSSLSYTATDIANGDTALKTLIYGSSPTVWAQNTSAISGEYMEGEALEAPRQFWDENTMYLDQYMTSYGNFIGGLNSVDLHDMASLIITMYTDPDLGGQTVGTAWQKAAQLFWPVLFDDAFAGSFDAGSTSGQLATNQHYSQILREVIAYSTVTTNTVFGNTGIIALYNDANDLGNSVGADPQHSPSTIATYGKDIAQAFVQYAGELALNQILSKSSTDPVLSGVLNYANVANNHTLTVDFSNATWAAAGNVTLVNGSLSIVSRDTLVDHILGNTAYALGSLSVGGGPFVPNKQTLLNDLWGGTTDAVFDRVSFATVESGTTVMAVGASGKTQIFVGGGGADTVTGSSGNDLIYTAGGNDVIKPSAGKDFIVGGEGTDTLDFSGVSSAITLTYTQLDPQYLSMPSYATADHSIFGVYDQMEKFILTSGNDIVRANPGGYIDMGAGSGDTAVLYGNTLLQSSIAYVQNTSSHWYVTEIVNAKQFVLGVGDIAIQTLGNHFVQDPLGSGSGPTGGMANYVLYTHALTFNLTATACTVSDGTKTDTYDVVTDSFAGTNKGDTFYIGTGIDRLSSGTGDDHVSITGSGGIAHYIYTGGNDTITGVGRSGQIEFVDGIKASDVSFQALNARGWSTTSYGYSYICDVKINIAGHGSITLYNISSYKLSDGTLGYSTPQIYLSGGQSFNINNNFLLTGTYSSSDRITAFVPDFSTQSQEFDFSNHLVMNFGGLTKTLLIDQWAGTIDFENISFSASGNDLVISYGATAITVYQELGTDSTKVIPTLVFDDGFSMDIAHYSNWQAVAANYNGDNNNTAALNDTIYASNASAHTIHGYNGNDVIIGGDGNDTLYGDAGNDQLRGGGGDDTIYGGAGDDLLWGGSGTNTVSYADTTAGVTVSLAIATAQNTVGAGTDTISGFGNLTGSGYNDTLNGDANANVIIGGAGNDVIHGAAGNDTIYGEAGNDVMSGDDGVDTLSYADSIAAITVSLAITAAQVTGGAGTDTISGFENLTGSAYNDTLSGDTNANVISGGAGNDVIHGGAGNDTLEGDAGQDTLSGEDGNDIYIFQAGDSLASARDTIIELAGQGTDTIKLTGGILPSSVRTTMDASGNLIIHYSANDQIIVQAGLDANGNSTAGTLVENIAFDNGTILAVSSLPLFNASGAQILNGTTGNDFIDASSLPNAVSSHLMAGNDNINGSAYADTIYGEDGNDTIMGAAGNDVIDGGTGSDWASYVNDPSGITANLATGTVIDGWGNTDTLINIENIGGSSGNDLFVSNSGNNSFVGDGGVDTVSYAPAASGVTINLVTLKATGDGTDSLTGITNVIGSTHNDTFVSSTAGNIFTGNGGVDTVSYVSSKNSVTVNLATGTATGDGADTLIGISNAIGSTHNDTFISGSGNNTFTGNGGVDTVSYASAAHGVTASLATGAATGDGTDTLKAITNLTGSNYDDVMTGNSGNNVLNGGSGNDTIEGGTGNDTLVGGAGTDTLSYAHAASAITVSLAVTAAQATGGAGTDTVSTFENILGSAYNDHLTGNSSANVIEGGKGNDVLDGGAGSDTVTYAGSTAAVTVSLALTTAQNTVGAGTDTLTNFENLIGSAYNDKLTGSSAANVFHGGAGNDTLTGGGGADTLYGDAGADIFTFKASYVPAVATVADFKTSESDKLDLRDLLTAYDPVHQAIASFVHLTTSGANTIVSVDMDGTATAHGFVNVATLTGITGLDTHVADLVASGNLMVH